MSCVALCERRDRCAQGNLWSVRRKDNPVAIHFNGVFLAANADLHLTFAWKTQSYTEFGTCHPSRCVYKDDEIEESRRELELVHSEKETEKKSVIVDSSNFSILQALERSHQFELH